MPPEATEVPVSCPKCFTIELGNALAVFAGETGITNTIGFEKALEADRVTMVCIAIEEDEVEFTSGGIWVGEGEDHKVLVSQGEMSAPPPKSPRRWGLWDRAKRPILIFLLREIPEEVKQAGFDTFEKWAENVVAHCCVEGGE